MPMSRGMAELRGLRCLGALGRNQVFVKAFASSAQRRLAIGHAWLYELEARTIGGLGDIDTGGEGVL